MSECVLCLGNWRKQTFKVEILISELQSKLWKWDLRALNHGPHRPWAGRNTSRKHTLHTRPAPTPPTRVWTAAVSLTLKRTPCEHVFGVAQLIKVPASFVLTNKTVQSIFVRCPWDRAVSCSPKAHFPSKLAMLLVSGTFFFPTSEINEISISHLTQTDYASLFLFLFLFFPQISDIWSNSNLFSCLTFSNNWALALAELVSIISERKSPHFCSLLQVNGRGWYSVTTIPLLIDYFWTHPETSLWRLLG